ncbi:hypothetical protein IWZ01DRAFT_487057 [Phyllosticta capitalensis]
MAWMRGARTQGIRFWECVSLVPHQYSRIATPAANTITISTQLQLSSQASPPSPRPAIQGSALLLAFSVSPTDVGALYLRNPPSYAQVRGLERIGVVLNPRPNINNRETAMINLVKVARPTTMLMHLLGPEHDYSDNHGRQTYNYAHAPACGSFNPVATPYAPPTWMQSAPPVNHYMPYQYGYGQPGPYLRNMEAAMNYLIFAMVYMLQAERLLAGW